jgi:membrane-associated phospholipid phosphatase
MHHRHAGNYLCNQFPRMMLSLSIPWPSLTKLADTVVTLPAATLCLLWLAYGNRWRLAVLWGALLGVGLLLVTITKLAFIGWGIGIHWLDFTGISGHVMRATAIAPVMFYLVTKDARPFVRYASVVAGMLFGMIIGVSRIMVHAHSWSEVFSGYLLGALISWAFIRLLVRAPRLALPNWAIALGLLVLVPMPLSSAAPTEQWLTHIALTLSGNSRPYTRSDL